MIFAKLKDIPCGLCSFDVDTQHDEQQAKRHLKTLTQAYKNRSFAKVIISGMIIGASITAAVFSFVLMGGSQ